MGNVSIPNVKDLNPKTIQKIFNDLQQAINGFDLDTGWVAKQTPYTHRLGVVPSFVQIQISDDAKGSDYLTIHPDKVNRETISFTSTKAYMRLLADK